MINYYTKIENDDLLDLKANLTDLDNYYRKISLISATRYVLS